MISDFPDTSPTPPMIQSPQPTTLSCTGPLLLRASISALFAGCSSLSLPIVIIVARNRDEQSELSLHDKIILPALLYGCFLIMRGWLVWNSVGGRLNGRRDLPISATSEPMIQDPWHVFLALCANLTSISQVTLGVWIAFPYMHPAALWPIMTICGLLNYMVDLYTDVVDSFRKHAEYHKLQGRTLAPLFQQSLASYCYQHAGAIVILIRELLPLARGVVRFRIAMTALSGVMPDHPMKATLLKAFLLPLLYWPAAYSVGFELVQLKDNFEAINQPFNVQRAWSRSQYCFQRAVAHVISGQLLMNGLLWCRLSLRSSTNVVLALHVVNLALMIKGALNVYVSSIDEAAVESGEKGIVMQYYLGQEEAMRLAPGCEWGIIGFAGLVAVCGTFAQAATIHQYAEYCQSNNLNQVLADDNQEITNKEEHSSEIDASTVRTLL